MLKLLNRKANLEKVLGKGSFGSIYISYNLRDNLPVSVKKEEKKPPRT